MDVPGERVAAARGTRLVVENEGPERAARLDAVHAPRLRGIAGPLVVVAAHDGELECLARFAPRRETPEGARGAALGAVQEIAEEDDVRGTRLVDRAPEPFHVLGGRARRQRYSGAAKARDLSQVEVSHEQRLLCGPIRDFFGKEHELLARDRALGHKRSNWAASCDGVTSLALSYSSCMRFTRSASFSLLSFSRQRDTMIGNAKGEGLWGWRTSTDVTAMRRNPSESRENSSWRSSTSRSAWPRSGLAGSQRANTS